MDFDSNTNICIFMQNVSGRSIVIKEKLFQMHINFGCFFFIPLLNLQTLKMNDLYQSKL